MENTSDSPTGDLVYIPTLDELIVDYVNDELPKDVMAFKYYDTMQNRAAGRHGWAHRDELKNLAILHQSYKSMAYTARDRKQKPKMIVEKDQKPQHMGAPSMKSTEGE
jgi:hypothetical protein